MVRKKNLKTKVQNPKMEEDKILYGEHKLVCFACGEEIEDENSICPYCNTKIE